MKRLVITAFATLSLAASAAFADDPADCGKVNTVMLKIEGQVQERPLINRLQKANEQVLFLLKLCKGQGVVFTELSENGIDSENNVIDSEFGVTGKPCGNGGVEELGNRYEQSVAEKIGKLKNSIKPIESNLNTLNSILLECIRGQAPDAN